MRGPMVFPTLTSYHDHDEPHWHCPTTQPCRQRKSRRSTSRRRRRRRRRRHRPEDPSCCAAGRRRHRQRLSFKFDNPTGRCASTPTRRKAAQDEEGESPTQATQDPKAHWHAHRSTGANSRRQSRHQHSQPEHSAFADSPPRAGQAPGRPQPGARPPRFDSTAPLRATRQIPPKVEPTLMRLAGTEDRSYTYCRDYASFMVPKRRFSGGRKVPKHQKYTLESPQQAPPELLENKSF